MSDLYLLCGTVGTGKTTFARKLEEEGKAIHFSADEWMIHFFGSDLQRDEFEIRLEQCKEMIYKVCEKLLNNNCNVVLDFGFWKRSDRDYVRSRFCNCKIKLISFDCTDEEIKSRLQKRNANLSEYSYKITEEMYVLFSSWFERPTEDENPIIIG